MHQESRVLMRRVLTRVVPRAGTIRIEIFVLNEKDNISKRKVQKWIPNDPRNERAHTHMWRKVGLFGP